MSPFGYNLISRAIAARFDTLAVVFASGRSTARAKPLMTGGNRRNAVEMPQVSEMVETRRDRPLSSGSTPVSSYADLSTL